MIYYVRICKPQQAVIDESNHNNMTEIRLYISEYFNVELDEAIDICFWGEYKGHTILIDKIQKV